MKSKLPKEERIWQIVDEIRRLGQNLRLEDLISRTTDAGIEIDWWDLNRLLTSHRFDNRGFYTTPDRLVGVLSLYLADRKIDRVLDPWAGLGILITGLIDKCRIKGGLGIIKASMDYNVARQISRGMNIRWEDGNPLDIITPKLGEFDLIVSCLPLGMLPKEIEFGTPTHGKIKIKDNEDRLILLKACTLLGKDGEAIFCVSEGFFSISSKKTLETLSQLGFSIHSVINIPSKELYPEISVPVNLVFIKRGSFDRWFVGKLSENNDRNKVLLANLRNRRPAKDFELGQIVESVKFRGYRGIEADNRIQRLSSGLGLKEVKLKDVSTQINLTKAKDSPGFQEQPNAVYLPLIGPSDAVHLLSELKIKPHNYAQVVLDPELADAEYVAAFFNTPLGRAVRDQARSGTIIPKITKASLDEMLIFLPSKEKQLETISVSSTIRSLTSELEELHQRLWDEPIKFEEVQNDLSQFVKDEEVAERFEYWLDTLPFPLASILWAYHVDEEYSKTKYEHLLHFFEALSAFMATVLLSGIVGDEELFQYERKKISEILEKQHLSYERTSFGMWKVIVERLSKAVRDMLFSNESDKVDHCQSLFCVRDDKVLSMLSSSKLVSILQETNGLRNSWIGHGGIVSEVEAKQRHEKLKSYLASVREVFGKTWDRFTLVLPGKSGYSKNLHKYDNARRVMGTRTPFEIIKLEMEHPLEENQLYLVSNDERRALKIFPLLKVMPSPQTAQNACYFYNRREDGKLRFVSYHFPQEAEIKEAFTDTAQVIELLSSRSMEDNND